MKVLIIILSGLLGLIILVYAAGVLASGKHDASMTRTYPVSSERTWNAITDMMADPKFHPRITSVEPIVTKDGRPIKWKERTADGHVLTFEEAAWEPQKAYAVRLAANDLGIAGVWRYELSVKASGTAVTISESSMITDAWFRSVMLFAGRNAYLAHEFDVLDRKLH